MDLPIGKKYHKPIIFVFILFFMGFALCLRLIPLLFLPDKGIFPLSDTDTWYNLRQIEVMVNHFPLYNWFDPMTAYPTGKVIDWGPLYPTISALLCLIAGASSENAIISISGLVSPLMAVAVVPAVFALGRVIWNTKTGIVAAGLVSVISFQYFSISSYGWVDHHIAEVLFTTLFFLIYLVALVKMERTPPSFTDKSTLIVPFILSISAGVILFLGIIDSTTVLLALLVMMLFTAIQSILDHLSLIHI